jgi:hypothetical protein
LFTSIGAGTDNTPDPGTYTFYVARREDRNIGSAIDDDGNSKTAQIYEGCQSALTRIDIFVYGIPDTPTGMLTDINASSGELIYNTRILPTDAISSPGLTNVQYRWYRNANDPKEDVDEMFDQTDESATTSFANITTLGEGFAGLGTNGYYQVSSTYNTTIYLSQVTHLLNRVTSSITTTFGGCETEIIDRAAIDITFYPIADKPIIGTVDYQDNKTFYDENSDNIGEVVELSYPYIGLNGGEEFYAKTFYTDLLNGQYFTWYSSNASGIRNPLSAIAVADPKGEVITAAEMLIAGITNNEIRYFLVTQTTDVEPTSLYEGSESEGTLLKINIYDVPDEPVEISSSNSADPGKVHFYYCEDELIEPIDVKSYDNDYPGDIIFYWYKSEFDALSQDSTKRLSTVDPTGAQILPNEMLNDDFANDFSTPFDLSGTVSPGTYTFYVTQASNKRYLPSTGYVGDPFFGSEGDPLEFIIYVRDIPIVPSVLDPTLFICETDGAPTFTISAFDSKITYQWYDSLGTLLGVGQTLRPQNFTEPGFYGYDVTQKKDINLNNEGFEGCESPVTELMLKVSAIPDEPITTGVFDASNNYYVYEICEGDTIADFFIKNPLLANQSSGTLEYIWYDKENKRLNTTSSENFNVENYVDLTTLKPEVPNDFRFRVSVTTDINDSENFDGCISGYTDIILRINGLPNLSFSSIATNDAYCLEEDQIIFSAQSSGIDGVGTFSFYNDFSKFGTGLTLGDANTAYVNLDITHLSDDDLVNPIEKSKRLMIGGRPTSRNVYFKFTDIKGCVNVDSVTNIIINPYPAIDFKIDNTLIDTFYTCLNEEYDVFEERIFGLLGINAETGAGIGGGGIYSDFRIYDSNSKELSFGLSDDSQAEAQFTPKDARKSLSLTDDNIQDYNPTSTYIVSFTHMDDQGCTSTVDNTITVFPKPQFGTTENGFVITNKACVADLLNIDVNLGNMPNNEATFEWKIRNDIVPDQYTNQVSIISDDYNLGSGGVFITVKATNDETGCAWQQTEGKSIGIIPTPEFRWENITTGEDMFFEFRERKLELFDSAWQEILKFSFELEGGSTNSFKKTFQRNGISNQILDTLGVSLSDPGVYKATFYLQSTAFCDSTLVREFNVLNKIVVPSEGLFHTFDGSAEYWHTDSISVDGYYDGLGYDLTKDKVALSEADLRYSTWSWNQPRGEKINHDNAPTYVMDSAWVTNPTGGYAGKGADNSSAEHSWVYSPSYDLSLLEKPTLSFDYSSDLLVTDGVVLQYSINNGATWLQLGSFDFVADGGQGISSGINWYTFTGIPGNPGNFDVFDRSAYNPAGYGWNMATDNQWRRAIHKIDLKDDNGRLIIPKEGWSDIRFRFALGSMSGQKKDETGLDLEGFAFDNFSLYNRDRVVLVESFGSLLDANSRQADSITYKRINESDDGSIWISYFSNLNEDGSNSFADPFYKRNEIDPDARRSFYGVNILPTSILNGEVAPAASDEEILSWKKSQLDQKELVRPDFTIELVDQLVSVNDRISVTGNFRSKIDIKDNETELSFRFFVVEKFITGQRIGAYQETDTIRNILRKILPSASGYVEKGSVAAGDLFTFEVNWVIEGLYNVEQYLPYLPPLRIIAMVQNEVTTEIYQVAFIDIDSKSNTITGIQDNLAVGQDFSIYPNPVDKEFRIAFEKTLQEETEWILFDQMGRQKLVGIIPKNSTELLIEVEGLTSGVYFVQLFHPNFLWAPKRIIVIH